jgi:Family of unknown function (DUF6657)
MTEIKSALEIALERTQGVVGDKEKIEADNFTKEGKRLASSLLNPVDETSASDVKTRLKAYSGKQLGWVREGLFQALTANIVLPFDESYRQKLDAVARGLGEVVPDKKRTAYVFEQLTKFFEQYLDNRAAVRQQLEQQFAAHLKQREAQLSQQVRQKVRLNPMQDPEFANALQRNIGRLDERYQEALDGLKEELKRMFEASR